MPQDTGYDAIEFHQFGSTEDGDRLILFAAPANEIYSWAGIPRKAWRLRMLYQRWITPGREAEVRQFWDDAASYDREGRRYLLGPTALTIAATEPIEMLDGRIQLAYEPPFKVTDPELDRLAMVAGRALARLTVRLAPSEEQVVAEASKDLDYNFDEYEHNQVLHSAVQIAQMTENPESFCDHHELSAEELRELVQALEAFTRPALVVDGQHRLIGAALSSQAKSIRLPVVLIPHAGWVDQIYQFVLINETAKKVETSLLTDIFGSSLTPTEQDEVRQLLANSGINVEQRIAAAIAGQHPDSPFRRMVRLKLDNTSIEAQAGYLPEATIRQLIDGGRGATGWRTDTDFYEGYVEPTIPDREEWESWTAGKWREYWFAFWRAVRDHYNSDNETKKSGVVLWSTSAQTNLTKAVTLRLLQALFMDRAVTRVAAAYNVRDILRDRLGEEEADVIVKAEVAKYALPATVEEFEGQVKEWFLSKGIPVRVFPGYLV